MRIIFYGLSIAVVFSTLFFGKVGNVFAVSSPRNDIILENISADVSSVQVGQDINFTITVKNVSPNKKFIKAMCFESSDGNFGCQRNFNLDPNQAFSFSNSGRWTSGGIKSIWIAWTQDGVNYYIPRNSQMLQILIIN